MEPFVERRYRKRMRRGEQVRKTASLLSGPENAIATIRSLDSFRIVFPYLGHDQERSLCRAIGPGAFQPGERPMKKILIATALTLMCSSAFAQTGTGPAPQSDNMQKPGMNNMDKGSMDRNSMDKGSMSKDTTGMNGGMQKDKMKKDDMKK
jgi:pentapeptide MXKDX repeat protein